MAISYLSGERIQGIEVDRTGGTAGTWTATASLNTARKFGGGGGLKTSAIVFGGYVSGGRTALTETFNGTTWTESTGISSTPPSMDTALEAFTSGGNATSALSVGGYTGSANVTTVEAYEGGSAWTAKTSLGTAVRVNGCDGSADNALTCGGYTTGESNVTQTWETSGNVWTTQADTLSYSGQAYYGGNRTNGIRVGGYGGGSWKNTAETWSYDGSGTDGTWTSIGVVSVGVERSGIAGNGTNAVWAGGWNSSFTYINTCQSWDGSSWTTQTVYPIATGSQAAGTHSATTDGSMWCGGQAIITNTYYWSDPSSPTIPTNVPVGTRFEETDTRKIYRKTSVSTGAGTSADGTIANGSIDTTNQKFGTGCLDLTGSSSTFRVGDYYALLPAGTADFTISMWLRADVLSGSQEIIRSYSAGGAGGTPTNGLELHCSGTTLRIAANDADSTVDIGTLSTSTWYNLVMICTDSNDTWSYYLNNVTSTPTATSDANTITNPSSTADSYHFGSRNGGTEGLNGQLQDIIVFHRALTNDERIAIYNSGNGAKSSTAVTDHTDLKVYYPCTSLDGSTLPNKAGITEWTLRGTAA